VVFKEPPNGSGATEPRSGWKIVWFSRSREAAVRFFGIEWSREVDNGAAKRLKNFFTFFENLNTIRLSRGGVIHVKKCLSTRMFRNNLQIAVSTLYTKPLMHYDIIILTHKSKMSYSSI
jgi:hypothetical protein